MQASVRSLAGRRCLCFAAVIVSVIGADGPALAAQAEPAASTGRELRVRRIRFLQAALLADYRSRRTIEAPATPDAEAALRAYGEVYAGAIMRFADHDRVARLARRALQLGEDPALLLAAGDAAYMTSDFERAGTLLQQAVDGLEKTSQATPILHLANSRLRWFLVHTSKPDASAARARRCEDLLVAAILGEHPKAASREHLKSGQW